VLALGEVDEREAAWTSGLAVGGQHDLLRFRDL
jgi:hypothetical protein